MYGFHENILHSFRYHENILHNLLGYSQTRLDNNTNLGMLSEFTSHKNPWIILQNLGTTCDLFFNLYCNYISFQYSHAIYVHASRLHAAQLSIIHPNTIRSTHHVHTTRSRQAAIKSGSDGDQNHAIIMILQLL